ncbi:MAG: hypothetical protein LW809_01390 [Vampirovibrionales bacterium]|nr:hypothetical protein [Vampirovibrionales bacterium]
MPQPFDSQQINKALAWAKTPFSSKHWQSFLLDWGGVGKFNIFNAKSLLFLATSGMLVRFVGIGGTRCVVDWNDKSKDDETRRRQTAERIFIEVGGTFIATYVALQGMMDLSGKGMVLASQLLNKHHGLSPTVLLEKAHALKKIGKMNDDQIHKMTQGIMELTERKNPYSFGLNAPELNVLGKWKASDFAAKMEEKGLGDFYKSHKNQEGFVTFKGLLNENNHVDNYFARVNSAGLVTAVGATLFSAWLSGGPIQRANDLVFRPWYLERLRRKKHEAELKGKPFDANLHQRQTLSRGGGETQEPVAKFKPTLEHPLRQAHQRISLWSGRGS